MVMMLFKILLENSATSILLCGCFDDVLLHRLGLKFERSDECLRINAVILASWPGRAPKL